MEMVLGSIFWFLVATSLLVTFHEFGHFWVARRCGVKVLRFSIGLGRPLWSRRGRDGTEYAIAAIPLGGYVKMLDEREADVEFHELQRAFNRKSLRQRTAIVAAGPIFNLGFALFAFWLMLLVGVRDYAPYIGDAKGPAAAAGLQRGDLIVAVEGREASNWTHVLVDLTTRAYRGESVAIDVRRANSEIATRRLDTGQIGERVDEERIFEQLGLTPWHWEPPAVAYSLRAGDPAELAGLHSGDRILKVGDTPVDRFAQMSEAIQTEAKRHAGRVRLYVERADGGIRETVEIGARKEQRGDRQVWIIGIGADLRDTLRRYGPLAAVPQAFVETWRLTAGSVKVIWHMLAGDAQLKNVSGPISIAQFANYSAESGFAQFLRFLGLISLSLCIMNLLPIPILDGGHLLYYFIEWAKGSPLSDRAQAVGHYLGLGALLALMCLAFFNDLSRLVSS
ncbi:MAG: RIP metalloprotease RseP [Xanthomonadales bacterium]|nr:Regulator of sigma-E protease RseP [Xanthomonadales bacterium]MCC6593765.1 RIP metalloprotease RseP [Xanthomonadales bacterium]MCE7930202.1 RIP metalloprotease RseP [Xanthomonadales bacterium PRO6]